MGQVSPKSLQDKIKKRQPLSPAERRFLARNMSLTHLMQRQMSTPSR